MYLRSEHVELDINLFEPVVFVNVKNKIDWCLEISVCVNNIGEMA